MRRPGQPASGQSRFGVALWPATRASASSLASVALAVFRHGGCDAAVLDGGQVGCGCREESRREDATSLQSQRKSTCHRSSARVSIGETEFASRSRKTRHIKRYRFDRIVIPRGLWSSDHYPDAIDNPVHPLPKPGHAPTRSLAWCTATRRPELSQPGWCECSFPRSLAQRRSWGSLLFAGLLPPAGDRPSLVDRAHLPFSFSLRPIDFRRADFTALSRERMRASSRAANRGFYECPASGLRSRLRSASPAIAGETILP
jgi:hypothetical protein